MFRRLSFLALPLLLLTACAEPAVETRPLGMHPDGGLLHPQAQYLPYRDFPRINLTLNDSTEHGDALDALKRPATGAHRVGADSTAPFGEVKSVVAIGEGLGVFDPFQHGLHLVSRDGRLGGTLGRQGTGPGEFQRMMAVFVPHPDTVLIADVMRRLELFTRTSGDTVWQATRTVPLAFSVSDICRLGDRTFAYGYAAPGTGGPIRELDADFAVLRQFGEGYRSENEGINSAISEDALLCDERAGRLVVLPRAGIGEIHILTPDGKVERIVHWSDYRSFTIEETGPGGYAVLGNDGGMNRLRTARMMSDGMLLAQYDWRSIAGLKAKDEYTVLHTLVIDLDRGEVVARSTELPPLSVVDAETTAVHLLEPWPGIEIRVSGHGL